MRSTNFSIADCHQTFVDQYFADSTEEQTFTRREKKLYAEAIQQRTAAKRPVKKRKKSAVGKAKQARS